MTLARWLITDVASALAVAEQGDAGALELALKQRLQVFEHEGLDIGKWQPREIGKRLPAYFFQFSVTANFAVQLLAAGIEEPCIETNRSIDWGDGAPDQVQTGQIRSYALLPPGRPGR